MNNQHPNTPTPELVERCLEMIKSGAPRSALCEMFDSGADAELKSCCEWLRSHGILERAIDALRAAARPKLPSLQELALAVLNDRSNYFDEAQKGIIIRALEEAIILMTTDFRVTTDFRALSYEEKFKLATNPNTPLEAMTNDN